ncbi:hypothetical protein SAY86_017701 [Trapa natans]|uniref:Uncharacterized protein n=1 Tax=Trapa natans TaxID=22666 RepID=A0AAN7R5A8_TRANT|nr:hypothetical protein SAY86_017701 [Trapa natans]
MAFHGLRETGPCPISEGVHEILFGYAKKKSLPAKQASIWACEKDSHQHGTEFISPSDG